MKRSVRRSVIQRESFAEDDVDDDFLERFAEETGWKSILLYQYLSGYIVFVACLCIISIAVVWLEMMHTLIFYNYSPRTTINDDGKMFIGIIYVIDFIYWVDIAFRILYAWTPWPNKKLINEPVPIEFIIIDILSSVPVDAMYQQVASSQRLSCLLRLRVLLRLYRIGTAINQLTKMFQEISHFATLFWCVILLSLSVIIPASLHYALYCRATTNCAFRDYQTFTTVYALASRFLTACGPDIDTSIELDFMYHVYSFAALFYSIITIYIVSDLTCKGINHLGPLCRFIHKFQTSIEVYRHFKTIHEKKWGHEDEQIYNTLKEYYYHLIRQRFGIDAEKVLHRILPPSTTNRLILDMAIDAFRHSHIFRHLPLHVIQFMSLLCSFDFAVPGQVVARKGEVLDKLIYIRYGILQILSYEDGESPVLNMSAGTCLGETSLFISFPLNCTIICQTYSELVILKKNDFNEIIDFYPKEYRRLVKVIQERFDDARTLRGFVSDKIDPHMFKSDLLIMTWIKQFQRYYLHAHDAEVMGTKIDGIQFYIDNLIFYIPYLDKLVISEEIELVKDSVFLKSTFHFILQPKSPILTLWKCIVIISTFFFILYYPYNLCFPEDDAYIQTILTIFVTILYWFDIYLQLVTAVKTRGATYIRIRSILIYRVQQVEFIVDCLAAFPLEYIFLFLTGQTTNILFILLQGNRLLNYYKIIVLFEELELWSTNLLALFTYVKYITHTFFAYYYAATAIYVLNCFKGICTPVFESMLGTVGVQRSLMRVLATLPLSNALLTGVVLGRMPETVLLYTMAGYLLITVAVYLLRITLMVQMIAASAAQRYNLLKKQSTFLRIAEAMDWFEVSKAYKASLRTYMNTLFHYKFEMVAQFNHMDLPNELCIAFKNIHLTRLLHKNSFFSTFPQDLLNTLIINMKMMIIPAGMVVAYGGELVEECYIIQKGYCVKWYGSRKSYESSNANLGLMEALLDIPLLHTITTSSDCVLLKILKKDLFHYFSKYEVEHKIVYAALAEFARCYKLFSLHRTKFYSTDESENEPLSYRKNSLGMKYKIGYFLTGVKSKFKLHTVSSSGKPLLYWEITRCTTFVLSMLVTYSWVELFGPNAGQRPLIIFLDLFNYVDIVLRMFVSYYDRHGIEVTKISNTSLHYILHAFPIEFIAAFPLDLIMLNYSLSYSRLNKWLLCYRLIGFANFITTRIRKVRGLVYFLHLIAFLVLVLMIAKIYDEYLCNERNGIFECDKNSWIYKVISTPVTPRSVFIETALLLVSVFGGVGFRRYNKVMNFSERLCLGFWNIVGFLSVAIVVGRAVSLQLFRNADLTLYQDAMQSLVRFLNYCDIDKQVKKETVQHFEYIWERRHGKDILDVIFGFPLSVQQDILFDIYGRYLRTPGSVFDVAEDSFVKKLLMYVKQRAFRKTGILYQVDDIHGIIFYLIKGTVEVLGPDQNRYTSLGAGSLFGCLDDCTETRQTLTMVARGHVETLTFRSKEFYQLLRQHPKFYTRYLSLTDMQFDYIKCITTETATEQQRFSKRMSRATRVHKNIIFRKIRTKIMSPSKTFHILQVSLFMLEFFLGNIYELMMHVLNLHTILIIFAYVRDLLWWIRMYIIFHMAYEDEFGMLVYDRHMIANRYVKFKGGFYFDLICILPLDIFMFAIPSQIYLKELWLLLRLNRSLRAVYLFRYISRTTHKLNINVLFIRTAYILMCAYLYLSAKFLVYYWSELVMDPLPYTNLQRVLNSLNSLDVILMANAQTTVPELVNFDTAACAALIVIIVADVLFRIFFYSNCVATLQIANKVKWKYISLCQELRQLTDICDVSVPLSDRIQLYAKLLWRIRGGTQFPFLLEKAPYYLREAVLNSMFGFHLSNHYVFKNCHVDFLRQLAATMRTLTYFQGNHITGKGDIDEKMYFIHEGTVQALNKDTLYTEICDRLLVAGQSFGLEQIMYPRCGQFNSYRARTLTMLVTIQRKDLTRLLMFFPSAEKHMYSLVEKPALD